MGRLRARATGLVLADRVARARGLARYVGLLTRPSVAPNEGLWFDRCSAVHTLGMRATVDLIFLDRTRRVMRCDAGVRPGHLVVSCSGADAVVEMGAGFLAAASLAIGDELEFDGGEP